MGTQTALVNTKVYAEPQVLGEPEVNKHVSVFKPQVLGEPEVNKHVSVFELQLSTLIMRISLPSWSSAFPGIKTPRQGLDLVCAYMFV